MTEEYFYGITLSDSNKSVTWDPEATDYNPRINKLVIRQALLGPDAKPDEINVVQVETMSMQETIKMPIAVLKAGETRHARLDIEFPDAPVTFNIIQGSGPVHVMGQQILSGPLEEFDDMEEMEEEMLDEEEGDDSELKGEDDEEPKGKKAKVSNNAKGKATSPKKNAKK